MKRALVKHLSSLIGVGLASVCAAQPASFQGIGQLTPGHHTVAYAVSADGRVVAGTAFISPYDIPIRWTAETGLQSIEPAPLGVRHWYPTGVSGDGSVVVGYSRDNRLPTRAFRWTAATGTVDLGMVPGQYKSAGASGVSGDGSTIVGACADSPTKDEVAFVWTESTGMTAFLPEVWHYATGISNDGSTIVGRGTGGAVRWTAATGTEVIGNGSYYPTAVSGDGLVVVGEENEVAGGAFRWSAGTGVEYLPFIPGAINADAFAVSGDGSVVVGRSWVHPPVTTEHAAWIWDEARGSRPLIEALRNEHGLDLDGWDLWWATGISADGRVIVGVGLNPCWQTQGWVARLGPGAPCDPDCNADESLTVADFACFQARFVVKNPYADCTRDCAFTVGDFGCFQTKFVAGCP